MQDLNFKKYKLLLNNEIIYKRKAIKLLIDFFSCRQNDLYYLFQQGEFPQKGKITDKILFFFHGLGCTVKNEEEGWSSTLEFGPNGKALAFDKGTLCYLLSVHMDACDDFIKKLQKENIIKLADEKLYSLLQENPNFNDWSSEEEEIDASVADKFVVIS